MAEVHGNRTHTGANKNKDLQESCGSIVEVPCSDVPRRFCKMRCAAWAKKKNFCWREVMPGNLSEPKGICLWSHDEIFLSKEIRYMIEGRKV